MLKRFLHHNPAEGNDPGAGAGAADITPDAGQDSSLPIDLGSGEGNQPVGGDNPPGDAGKENEPTVKSLTADLEAKSKELEAVTTKLGKQSAHVKTLRDLQASLDSNPQKTIAALAKNRNTKVFFEDPGSKLADIQKVFAEASDDERGALVKQLMDEAGGELRSEFSGVVETIFDTMKASEHPDWDDEPIVDTIASLKTAVDVGKMTNRELMYYAAKGFLSPDAIVAAKEEGKSEYIEELQRKNRGAVSPGDGGGAPGSEDDQSFEDIAIRLKGIY